jgi:hypothetical protein
MIRFLILLGALLVAGPGLAQDGHHGQGHAQHHDWYKELKQPGTGYSCCDDSDCRPTRAHQIGENEKCGVYNGVPGQWCAQVDGVWHLVPLRVILQKLAPDGNSHICAGKGSALGLPTALIYCFIGGIPKS